MWIKPTKKIESLKAKVHLQTQRQRHPGNMRKLSVCEQSSLSLSARTHITTVSNVKPSSNKTYLVAITGKFH